MLSLSKTNQYYYYNRICDMRKGFDGLSGLVLNQMNSNPRSGSVYIFINRSRDRIKLLHWDGDGFLLYYKRLESGRFKLSQTDNKSRKITLSWDELFFLLQGLELKKYRKTKRFNC